MGTTPALVLPVMDDELPAALSLLLPLLVVFGSLLHGFYAALFARLGLVNFRFLSRRGPGSSWMTGVARGDAPPIELGPSFRMSPPHKS